MSEATPASQRLEDLACAYWRSDVLFAALELGLFAHLAAGPLPLTDLARAADCQPDPLERLLHALAGLELVALKETGWHNLDLASRHLVPDQPDYLGDFLLYRRYLKPPWQGLATRVAGRPLSPGLCRQDDYLTRTWHYVRALDQLARQKASEIALLLADTVWNGPLLDVGGGAGALGRALRRGQPVTLFELPEVLAAARRLYPDPADWQGIETRSGDFRQADFPDHQRFGLVLLANFLHTYNATDSQSLICRAADLLLPGGLLLIHDYFPDRRPPAGQLYDLNMLLNTPQGRCHPASTLSSWLTGQGLAPRVLDLASDSSLILGRRPTC